MDLPIVLGLLQADKTMVIAATKMSTLLI